MPGPIIAIPRRMNFGRPQLTRLGPWPDGVNTKFDPDNLPKTVVLADNVDVLPNGELKQRPPIRQLNTAVVPNCYMNNAAIQTAMNGQPTAVNWRCELVYQTIAAGNSGTFPDIIGVFRATHSGNGPDLFSIVNLTAGTLLYSTASQVSNPVLYNGKIYVVTGTRTSGSTVVAWWDAHDPAGTNGNAVITWGTAEPPNAICIFKDRMYAFNADFNLSVEGPFDRIWYSASGDPLTWTGADAGFFTLSTTTEQIGARKRIRAVAGIRNTLYIFTTTDTWTLSMPSSGVPTNGILQPINNRIGVANERCIATFGDKLFVASSDGVYEVVNSNFVDIGYLLGERLSTSLSSNQGKDTAGLSVAFNKLYLHIGHQDQSPGGTQNVNVFSYVFNLKSRAWSSYSINDTWGSSQPILNILKIVPYQLSTGNNATLNVPEEAYSSGAILVEPHTGKVYHLSPNQDHVTADNWADYYGGADQSIVMTVWLPDFSGGTVDQAAWKRFYAVVTNLYRPKNGSNPGSLSLVFSDHNGNNVIDTSVSLPVGTTTYYSVKQYTSLRARHIQYYLQLDTGKAGPYSLLSLDVLAKLKASEPSAAVSN